MPFGTPTTILVLLLHLSQSIILSPRIVAPTAPPLYHPAQATLITMVLPAPIALWGSSPLGPPLSSDGGGSSSGSSVSSESSSDSSSVLTPIQDQTGWCASKVFYEDSSKSKHVLFAMCIGLCSADDDTPDEPRRILGDMTVEPYLSTKDKRMFKPVQKHLVAEVERREKLLNLVPATANTADLSTTTTPRRNSSVMTNKEGAPASTRSKGKKKKSPPKIKSFKNKGVVKLKEWLNDNILTNADDLAFIRAEEKKLYNCLVRAQAESRILLKNSAASLTVWDSTADLRLIHVLIDNDVKEVFLARHDSMTRQQLDGRNAPGRAMTWLEVIVQKYNDPTFKPWSQCLGYYHSDFLTPIDLSLDQVPCAVTQENVSMWLGDRKNKLITFKARVDRSGNGCGQPYEGGGGPQQVSVPVPQELLEDNGDDAVVPHVMMYQSDGRENFLQYDRPTLLYYWHMIDVHQMLQNTLSMLSAEYAVSSGGGTNVIDLTTAHCSSAMSSTTTQKQSQRNDPSPAVQSLLMDMTKSIKNISSGGAVNSNERDKSETMYRLKTAEDSFVKFMDLVERTTEPHAKAIYQKRLDMAKRRLEQNEAAYEQLEKKHRQGTEQEQQAGGEEEELSDSE